MTERQEKPEIKSKKAAAPGAKRSYKKYYRKWRMAENKQPQSINKADRHPAVQNLHIPRSRSGLDRLCRQLLGVKIPSRPLCEHHQSPMDYLEASFLRQEDLLVWANRGGGKTMLAAAATLLDAIYRAPVNIRVLGGSFDQSDRLAEYIRHFLNRRPELLDGPIRKESVRIVGGSEIRMLAQSQRAIRGQHVQKIRCDEVDLFDADVWQAVQFATRSEGASRGSIEVLSTLHRTGGLMDELVRKAELCGPACGELSGYKLVNWCLWEVIERCPASRKCKDCLLAEDCRGKARKGAGFFRIDDAITIKARSSRAAWESEMLCKGPHRRNAVFEEFNPAVHIGPVTYRPEWPLYRAIDFGYASPLVCLWIQLTPGGHVHVLQEYVRSRLPMVRHAQAILEKDPGRVRLTYVDPAGAGREPGSGAACTEILAEAGIPCAYRPSRIEYGVELIRSFLAPAAGGTHLRIDPGCKTLIDSMRNYHYPDPGKGDPERPVKDGADHAVDALRYFFVNRLRPAQKIQRANY